MQLNKLLLQSIALGLTVGLAPSCSEETKMELDPDDCVEGCTDNCVGECVNATPEAYWPDYGDSCPACGMG
ncbi:hypothetical protein CLV84_3521 [Neolewinella xylanilytica]|uniref:Uncharacterized protein n=1 Tax=Neolewinella xylanilytica TaxID=1514080 RepID=A0A2S6I5Z5_9BACT|nr:hypothetical protein [Neolewinella xylanilytica]PPK86586.1 hypothetical protein CLV84_3521 [Neolewinella xylanilytica]